MHVFLLSEFPPTNVFSVLIDPSGNLLTGPQQKPGSPRLVNSPKMGVELFWMFISKLDLWECGGALLSGSSLCDLPDDAVCQIVVDELAEEDEEGVRNGIRLLPVVDEPGKNQAYSFLNVSFCESMYCMYPYVGTKNS